ncbi:MAG: hypothetical protein DRR00_06105, partial [Candidatus Parabeggiatoa sp. nov. 3]
AGRKMTCIPSGPQNEFGTKSSRKMNLERKVGRKMNLERKVGSKMNLERKAGRKMNLERKVGRKMTCIPSGPQNDMHSQRAAK